MRRKSAGDAALDTFIYASLTIAALATLLPFANVFSKAFSAEWAVVSGKVGLWPIDFQLDTMKYVVTSESFLKALGISVFLAGVGTLLSILLTAVTAYPLSKRHLPGTGAILVLFVFTMLFSGGIIPNYLLIRELGLMNNLWSLILPAMISVFNMLVIKSYYESLPESLEEAAKLEGAGNLRVLFFIVLPLSGPVLATISLFYAVYFWNDFFHPMLYINNPSLRPLQLYLRDIVMEADTTQGGVEKTLDELMNLTPEGIRAATVIASTVPILLVYPYLQKYFIKGVLIGSVKG
ncbi:carbohydrate ABC transporter permease [Paenibacillus antri]|uniref:Carbohydrate ABC transporter permease n=1 Tax=Paenibacillus antri TaxID=2582848 RepID=A0A5R9G6A1_9BACL|nr:carbohydrate ABC transporter permease [Paenibacillus antri]TLS51912.1 carbohydrate ABC transporter permease [Paenibacillus antri]